MSAYVPNGRALDHEHYQYKLRWLERLVGHLDAVADPSVPVAVCGDFNIAPTDADVWDITELTIDGCAQGQTEGLFETIDYNVVKSEGFDPVVVQPTYIAINDYSNVIGWSTEKFGDAGPQSWADFWNVEKFPGRRSLRNDPQGKTFAQMLLDIELPVPAGAVA